MTSEEYDRELDERDMNEMLKRLGISIVTRALKHVANVRMAGWERAHSRLCDINGEIFKEEFEKLAGKVR